MQSSLAKSSILKHALFNQYNVILVGGMALFSAALGSVLPLLIAGGGELLWLIGGPQSGAFRSWVADQARQREEQSWRAQVEDAAVGLDPPLVARLRSVGDTLMNISGLIGERGQADLTAAVGQNRGILLQAYANLAAAQRRVARLVDNGGAEAVETEIANLHRALADEKDSTVRISLRQAIALAQRRLKKFEHIESVRRDLDVKVSTFEGSLEFIRSQARGGEPEDEIMVALNDTLAAARFNPEYEADAASRTLGERRITSTVRF